MKRILVSVLFFVPFFVLSHVAQAQKPTIVSFTPASGPVGTSVTIIGTNFSATASSNIVFFGATKATVTSATTTSLIVTVPFGATYQPFTVLTNSLIAYSNKPFVVTIGGNGLDANSFGAKVDVAGLSTPTSVAIGNFDGGSKPDISVGNGTSTLSLLGNTSAAVGSFSFASKIDLTTGSTPKSVGIGDLNNDGNLDMAVANGSSNSVSVFTNCFAGGSICFNTKVDLVAGTNPISISIGDLDGDGKADIVVLNQTSNTLSVFRNSSTLPALSFATKADFTTGTNPISVSMGDVDGDGKIDLAVANNTSSTVSVLRNTSTGPGSISFATKADFSLPGGFVVSVYLDDIDGDTKPDMAVGNSGSTLSIFRNTSTVGSISFAAKSDFTAGSGPVSISGADLDGNGKVDLVVTNFTSNTVSVFGNTSTVGTIGFANKVDFAAGTNPNSVSIADLDADGKSDLITSNQGSNSISVFRNTVATNLASEPTAQPTNLFVADLNSTDFTYDITAATGVTGGYLHIYKAGTAPTFVPVDGVEHVQDDVLPDGSIVGYTDNIVAGNFYDGLTPGTTYHIKVFAYNGSGTTTNYLTTAPLSATITTLGAISTEPTNQPTGLTFSSITTSSYAFSFTAAVAGTTAPDGYIGIRKIGSAPTSAPVDGTTYLYPDAIGDGETNFVGTGTSYTQSGATPSTAYYFAIYSYKGSGTSINYKQLSPLTGNVTTLASIAPTIASFTPASGSIGTSVTITGTNFSTTAANNIVKFNGTVATVTGVPTATSITVTVPTGATTGKITVEVASQIATSATDFTIPTGWTTKASMITPRWGSGIGNVGDVVSVAGGYIPTLHLTTVEAYTISTNSWVAKASRPGVQTSPAYGVINSILYTAGGTNSSVEISDLWSYNPVSDIWTSRAALPAVRQAACGGVISGLFYVVGGRVGSVSQSSMVAYDPVANSWSTKASMPTARYGAASGVINGLLYVAGGISVENNTVFSTLEVYDPVANTWTTRAAMPTARYGAAYEVLNGMLYVIGGGNSALTVVSTVEAYNPITNAWSTVPSLAFARAYAAAIVSNGSIFVTGGHNSSNTAVSAVEQYGGSAATPTITSFTPTSGLVGSSVVITGTNFSTTSANNTVKFNGTTATVTGTPTATSITATVPVGATTGTLSVTVGGQTGTSAGTFTVTIASTPTVASFLPITGTIGTSVTLTGTNFSTTPANNIVKFNGTTATVTASTTTSITTTVPTGATTGKITVEVSSQIGTSLTDFTVTSVTLATEPTNSPTGLTFSSITSTSYAFSFTAAVAGTTAPDGYLVLHREGSAPTGVPADGITYLTSDALGDGFVNFIGTGTSYTQTSVTPSTAQHLAIYSYKGSGATINYKQVSPLTGSVTTLSGTDTTDPFVNNNTTATSVAKGAAVNVTVTLTDAESGIAEATIYYATLEDAKDDYSNFTSGTMIKGTGDNYTFQIPGSFVKEMGVTYYFYLENGVGLTNYSSDYFAAVQLTGEGLTIPFAGFGTDQSNYRIVSIPVKATAASADAIFGDDLGAYDKKKWRLFRYQGSMTELNGRSLLEVGNGYWLIASKSVSLDTGPGTTSTVAVFDPFKLTLSTGWNQIGNPYPYDIKWQAILTWNGDPAGINKLRTYNGNWQDGAELEKFSGGFVFNGGTSSVTLEIPTIKDPSINGRVSSSTPPAVKNPIDQEDWSVNLLLEQGNITNEFGGLGMNHAATEGYDPYDDFNLPRFTDFVELNHIDKELHRSSYSKDVVPFNENHTWEFFVESSSTDLVTMKWDNSFFGNNNKQLVLWDMNLQRGLDMRKENQYIFNRSRSGHLKVFYGDEKYIKEKTAVNQLVFHDVFPNPAKDRVTISFSLPKEDHVIIEVIDLLGKKIATVADGSFKAGYHEVIWNALDHSGNAITNGIYITQIKGLNSDHQKRLSINK